MKTSGRWGLVLALAACALPGRAAAQDQVTLSGTVTDEAGRPLGAASVVIESLGAGSNTRSDGSYTIRIASRAIGQTVTVRARLVGFREQSKPLTLRAGANALSFELPQNPLQLGELVATGAGTVTEAEKLGNVRSYVPPELIDRANEANVVTSLAAKAPGVIVQSTSGEAGASASIQIRGQRTFYGSGQPLFVIDGMPVDNTTISTSTFDAASGGEIEGTAFSNALANINPQDIENVEILKGAAASTIYGARGANGVILITTKKGRAGQTRYSLRSALALDRVNNTYPLQTTWGFGDRERPGIGFRSWGPRLAAGTPVFDHYGELFTTGTNFDNTLTISGGNERTTFLLSAGRTDWNGIFVGNNDAFGRSSFRFNGSHMASDRLKIIANAQYSQTDGRFIQRGNNVSAVFLGGLRTPPEFNNRPFIDSVTGGQIAYTQPDPTGINDDRVVFDNPLWVIDQFRNTQTTQRMIGNVGFEWAPIDWLKVNYTLGVDFNQDRRLEGTPIGSASFVAGRVINGSITSNQIDHNLVATASYRLGKVSGTISAGQNLNQRQQRIVGDVGRTMTQQGLFILTNTATRDIPTDFESKVRLQGYFVQATADFLDQVYLTGGFRYDGGSTFGRNNLWSFFPKGSAAWQFTKATGTNSFLTFGKLRLAYGEAGQEPSPYLSLTTGSFASFTGGVQGVQVDQNVGGNSGITSSTVVGDPNLRNERSKELEGGFDLGLFKDKVDLQFTLYRTLTTGVILPFPLATSTGFSTINRNAGTLRNAGVEIAVNFRPYTSRDWTTQIGFQFASNRNRVLDLGDANVRFVELPGQSLNSMVLQVGEQFGVMRGNGFVRCGLTEPNAAIGFTEAVCAGQPQGALFIQANGFPALDPNTNRLLMNWNPRWTGNINALVRFRKLTFSALLDIRNGGQIWNGTKGALYSYGTHRDTEVRAACTLVAGATSCTGNELVFGQGVLPGETVVGPGAGRAVPIGFNWYRQGLGTTFNNSNEPFIEDGGFTRLREVSLQLTLDNDFVRKTLGMSSIDVRVAGRNLLTWTKYTGLDPETSLVQGTTGSQRRGEDYFNMPQTRSFVFTVILNR